MPERGITIGDRSHLITIIAPAGTLAVDETELEENVPAAITVVPLQFQRPESLGLGGVQAQTAYQVNVSYRTDIVHAYRLREQCCTERTFQVVTIIPSDKRDAIDMTCLVAG